jgi:hypothetical protein
MGRPEPVGRSRLQEELLPGQRSLARTTDERVRVDGPLTAVPKGLLYSQETTL